MEKINERYMFGEENGYICVIADGKRYILTCHPYEPCLFITDETGIKTAVQIIPLTTQKGIKLILKLFNQNTFSKRLME